MKHDSQITKLGAEILAGEGLFLSKFSGYGRVFLHSYMDIIVKDLKLGERIQVEAGNLLAFKVNMNYGFSKVVVSLYDKGVGEIDVGYSKGIVQDKGNERNSNFRNYSSIINRTKGVAQEYGIKVKLVNEVNAFKTYSLYGGIHENGRIERGLFKCPYTRKLISVDLNGAMNILHIPESVKNRGMWLKAQPMVYRWTNEWGWVTTSNKAIKIRAVNHRPMISIEGTTFPLGL